MRQVKLVNGVLWGANVLLGVGIFVYAFYFLIFPVRPNYLKEVTEDAGGSDRGRRAPPPAEYSVLRNLVNPVVPRGVETSGAPQMSEIERVAKLLGTNRIMDRPGSDVAYLQVLPTGQFVNAYIGQPVVYRDQTINELRGWTLVRLTEAGALFTNGVKEAELKRDDISASAVGAVGRVKGPSGGGGGGPFDPDQSKSRRTAATDTHESWLVDRDEVQWAMQNVEDLLGEVALSAYPSGGVKIDSVGSFASKRGFVEGDVVKKVNGYPLRDPSDLINYANNPQFRNAGAMVVEVERAGRMYTLDFRPDFSNKQR